MQAVGLINWFMASFTFVSERFRGVFRRSETIVNLAITVGSDSNTDGQDKQTTRYICVKLSDTAITLDGMGKEEWLTDENLTVVWNAHPDKNEVKRLSVKQFPTLSCIPYSIGKFENLTTMDFSHNKLQELPFSMIYLRNLQILNLSNNMFETFPPILDHVTTLERLILTNNKLRYLPTSLLHLVKLKELRVSGNPRLIFPPPHVCAAGVHAIFKHMQNRSGRANLFSKTAQHYTKCQQTKTGQSRVKSLLELCVANVLRFRVDYISMAHIPPALKRHLHNTQTEQQFAVSLAKCSRCEQYFTTRANFDGHDCNV